MPSPKFPTRAAAALVVAVAVSLAGFALAILALRDRSNERAAAESVGLMATRLTDLRRELAAVTGDYNIWEAAYQAMMAGDLVWVYDNYAASAVNGLVMDGLVLFGQPFPEPLGWTAAAPSTEPSPSHLPADLLARITREVLTQPLGERVTYDAATVIDGRLALVSAMRTQPDDPAAVAHLDPAGFPIAALTETLGEEDLAALAESLFLEAVSFGPLPVAGLASLPVAGPDGETLGHLAWVPPRPGSEIVAVMAPVLVAAGLAFAALGGVAAWLVRAHARRLVWEEAEARRLARTDPLTGLPNRLAFGEHLAWLTRDKAPQAAVLFLDLNGFKRVNDTLGHAAGDALVAEVAGRLAPLAGDGAGGGTAGGAFLARLGGDEFAFVLAGPGGVAASAGDLSRRASAALADPFVVVGQEVRVSASQGLALRDAPDVPLDELVRRADTAMYRAKRERAGAARAYSLELDGGMAACSWDGREPSPAARLI